MDFEKQSIFAIEKIRKGLEFDESSSSDLLNPDFSFKRRLSWTKEEDDAIIALVKVCGTKNWTLLASKMGEEYGFFNRTGKQCRERWHNHLDPNIKKDYWTEKEEAILFLKHMEHGNKWSDIARFMPGRTDNAIKNHFYSKLRKFIRKILKVLHRENFFEVNKVDIGKYNADYIYKMIKKQKVPYNSLSKELVVDLIMKQNMKEGSKGIYDFIFNDVKSSPQLSSTTQEGTTSRGTSPFELCNGTPQLRNFSPNPEASPVITNNYVYHNQPSNDQGYRSILETMNAVNALKNQVHINQFNFNNFSNMMSNPALDNEMKMNLLQLCCMNLGLLNGNSNNNNPQNQQAFNNLNPGSVMYNNHNNYPQQMNYNQPAAYTNQYDVSNQRSGYYTTPSNNFQNAPLYYNNTSDQVIYKPPVNVEPQCTKCTCSQSTASNPQIPVSQSFPISTPLDQNSLERFKFFCETQTENPVADTTNHSHSTVTYVNNFGLSPKISMAKPN